MRQTPARAYNRGSPACLRTGTHGCYRLYSMGPEQNLDRPLSECVDDLDAGRPCGGHEAPDDSHAGGKQ